MNENDENIIEVTPDSNGAQEIVAKTLCKAGYIATELANEINAVSPDSLIAADKRGTQLDLDILGKGETSIRQGNSLVKREVQEITEEQRRKLQQYEEDKAFYEKQILQKVRTAAAINNDAIKIMHPTYRTKFMEELARYGTLQVALLNMREKYGVTVRKDVLLRMRNMVPAFDAEIEDALALYQGRLQKAMHERAVEGVDKNVYDKEGNIIAVDKVYSDSLLAKMVDVHNPEYKEARQKEDKRGGGNITVQIIKDFHNYKKEQ